MTKYKNSVLIEDKVVKKKYKKDLLELYDFLESRNFDNFPKVIDNDEKFIRSEFIESKPHHEMTKGVEFMRVVSLLHYKTLYFKEINKSKYKNIYNKLSSNIEYLKEYYLNIIESIEEEVYMSPSHYLFARNYSVIDSSLKYAKSELDKWYKKVENKTKERVCTNHNNLSLEHFIYRDKGYLLSFDNYLVDTPILDLYKFYRKEGYKLDFNYLLDVYSENLTLLEEERMLFNVLISIPPKIEMIKNEYYNTINISDSLKYIYSGIDVVNKKEES